MRSDPRCGQESAQVGQVHVAAYRVGPDGWLFTGPTGDPPHQNTVGYWWRKTLRDAVLPGVKLHDLGHFLPAA